MIEDDIIHFENTQMVISVKLKEKTGNKKAQLISQLVKMDKQSISRIIAGMCIKTKFQTFFEQNIQIAQLYETRNNIYNR
jgi:hypothetical protein